MSTYGEAKPHDEANALLDSYMSEREHAWWAQVGQDEIAAASAETLPPPGGQEHELRRVQWSFT